MEYKKISDLATVVTGGTPSTSVKEYWENGNIPWLQSGCCQNCDVFTTENYITQKGYDNSSTRLMPVNTVMIALTGATAGKIGYLKFEACGNQSITGIFPNKSLSQRYLFYYLISRRAQILADCVGGAQAHISQGYVKNIIIPLVSLNEQKKIASILDQVAAIKAARQKQLDALDELVKARFVEMFGDLEEGSGKYETKKLWELSSKISDGVHAKPEYTATGRPFISVVNINKKRIDFSKCKYVSEEAFQKMIQSTRPEKGDVLYTKVGATYGIPAYVDTDIEFCLYVSVCLIKPLHNMIDAKFLALQMDMPFVKHQADCRIKGIGVPDLHLNQIREFDIIYPPIELQKEFTSFVEKVEYVKKKIDKSLSETETLFQSLMQEYFG